MAEPRRLFNVSCHPQRNDCETVILAANLAVSNRLLRQPANMPTSHGGGGDFSISVRC
jgi:hypothetical protein